MRSTEVRRRRRRSTAASALLSIVIWTSLPESSLGFRPTMSRMPPQIASANRAAAAAAGCSARRSAPAMTVAPAVRCRAGSRRSKASSTKLLSSRNDDAVEITYPTPDEAAAIGCRDWPQQFKTGTWADSVPEGQIFTCYVLDGNGRVTINYVNDGGAPSVRKDRVYPGTLLEVDGEATVVWTADDERAGMILLTPGFKEGGVFALVAGFLVVLCVALVAGVGGG